MNTTEPQPDPSPAQREPELYISHRGTLCLRSKPIRPIALMHPADCPDEKRTAQMSDDALRLVNGWNALPLLEMAEKALEEMTLEVVTTYKELASIMPPEHRQLMEQKIARATAALTAIRESKGK